MVKYKIYCLKHPITLEIKYIGVTTVELNMRLSQHIHTGKNPLKRGTIVSKWIYSLLKENLKPIMELIEECDENNWEEREVYWISFYPNLKNQLPGGKGVVINRSLSSIQRSADGHKIKIVQIGHDKKLIKIWDSAIDACKFFGFKSHSAITNVLSKYSNTAAGYYWFYLSDYNSGNIVFRKNKTTVDYTKLNKAFLYDSNGKFIKEYKCLHKLVLDVYSKVSFYSAALAALKEMRIYKQYYMSYKKVKNFFELYDIV